MSQYHFRVYSSAKIWIPLYSVERTSGSFDTSLITWQLYEINESDELVPAVANNDFEVVYGVLTFVEGVRSQDIELQTINENDPEVTERFRVVLLNATEGRITEGNDSSVDVAIAASDGPHGVFGFTISDIWIAEDIADDNEYNGTASYNVSRTAGAFGTVTVSEMNNSNNYQYSPLPSSFRLFGRHVPFLPPPSLGILI